MAVLTKSACNVCLCTRSVVKGFVDRFGKLAPAGPEEQFDTLLQRLIEDLIELERSQQLRPDLVVLTGDLTEWGLKTEFEQVLMFADRLAKHLKLGRDRVLQLHPQRCITS